MKKIGFIGAFDKTDFILYIAKILVEMGKRVLVVDATVTQKARYIVPNIQSARAYVTNFEGIDIAVGLRNFEEIKAFLGIPPTQDIGYDIALVDTSSAGGVMSFDIKTSDLIYFATSLDMYSIRRGIESLAGLSEKVNATKILFTKESTKEENDYLNYLTLGSNINWNEEVIIYMPFESGDQTTIYKNQRVAKIKLRPLSTQYKEGLIYIANQILGNNDYQNIRKVFKKIEKGV